MIELNENTETSIILLSSERELLDRCETIIARGFKTYIEVGNALLEIRDQRLYRTTHRTFADYCNERWDMSRQRAYQLIDASEIVADLSTIVDTHAIPESHLRVIAKATPADRPKVIERATELAGDQPRTAKHIEQAVAETTAPALNLLDLGDILLRLDAHGYAKTSTRQKGMTTFYSFRDFRSTLDEGNAGELELAEGELAYWLAELDSNAAYAQAKQEKYMDAQARADRLGYDLKRDGAQFVLTPAGQRVPALRGALDQLIKAIAGYEKNAAKKAAATPAPTLAELDESMPKNLERAGYYWKSAQPIIIAHNDGWTGEAGLIATAITLAADREQARAAVQPELADWWNHLRAIERAMQKKKYGDACAATFGLLRLISGNDPKTRAAALLIAIEREMKGITTDDQEGLSQAIADLNECQEGTEVRHWISAGYALLDLEATE